MIVDALSAQRALRRQPACRLAGDRGDALVVLVVMQNADVSRFRGRGDQEIGVLDRTLRRAALGAELLVDPQRTVPLILLDRAIGQLGKLLTNLRKLGRAARAVEKLETNHVACREFAVDERRVERVAQLGVPAPA